MEDRWNNNIHYHALILEALKGVAGRVLDVGCGEGQLARALATVKERRVLGVDPHEDSIDRARRAKGGVEYVAADFLSHPFEPNSWDAITSIAALHHMDFREALVRIRNLLRRDGIFVAVGLARSGPLDLPWDGLGFIAKPFVRRGRKDWIHGSPSIWPPPKTYRQVRNEATELLPGVVYRRHLLFRYSLIWRKP